jgi:hypothetical protein
MTEVLVDVVAAAARVAAGTPAPASATEQPAETTAGAATAMCPLGHQQAAGLRFCGSCGMPMDAVQLAERVDLEAVRAAVQSGSMDAETRARKDREHAAALAANARAEQEVVDISQVADPSERKILIHFVSDGFTWKKVWTRGEMLEIGPDHPWWDSAQSWIRLSKVEQFNRYGKVFFDYGPYPGAQHRPGTEVPLPTAPANLWAEARGALPASASPDRDGSLVPW